jgi:hypothetical protein
MAQQDKSMLDKAKDAVAAAGEKIGEVSRGF